MSSKILLWNYFKYLHHCCKSKNGMYHSILGCTESNGSHVPKPLVPDFYATKYGLVQNHAATQRKPGTLVSNTDEKLKIMPLSDSCSVHRVLVNLSINCTLNITFIGKSSQPNCFMSFNKHQPGKLGLQKRSTSFQLCSGRATIICKSQH